MNFIFRQKRLTGILTVIPANERSFVEDMKHFNFAESRSLKLQQVMGYNKHRLVRPGVCVSDLAVFGLEHLFEKGLIARNGFDALIVVTQTPDYFMPPTSNVIQGRLGLKQDVFCMDINQGCAGFVIGLIQAFLLLEQPALKRVILINADVLSRKTSPQDRSNFPLIGDAASISLIERDTEDSSIHANLKMDGGRRDALIIPAGGLRTPSTPETAVLADLGDGNRRAEDHLHMDGSDVFNFVQLEIPQLIVDLLAASGDSISTIEYFLFHQPNRFMLEKLADKMKVPYAKMPSNVVEHFGNSSSATIPIVMAFNLAAQLKTGHCKVCLAGFGTGLTWASMLMRLGGLSYCEMLDYP
jgi:3-oxoacyl-[acyl-carrier-protein] synthase III